MNIHKEMKALVTSSWWKEISRVLEAKKKGIMDKMFDATSMVCFPWEDLTESQKKQLYLQHILKLHYDVIETVLQIPQTIINSTPPDSKETDTDKIMDEALSMFDRQYPL